MALVFRKSPDCLDMVVKNRSQIVGVLKCIHRTIPSPRYAPDLALAAWLDERPAMDLLPRTDWFHQSATLPVWVAMLNHISA